MCPGTDKQPTTTDSPPASDCKAIAKQPAALTPETPPGRSTRKARGYTGEIAQLRAQGYSLEAIRLALAAAGIEVSLSTVCR
jgi:hypothetical protein